MVPEVIIRIVNEYRSFIAFKDILKLFDIPKATYYRWLKKQESTVKLTANEELVIRLCKENKFRYGYRKITALIKRERNINKNTVQKIMQRYDCQCRVKIKRYRKNEVQAVSASNIIDRDFTAMRPLEKLSTDITYIPFGSKMLYLSSIMDLYNGEIINKGITMSMSRKGTPADNAPIESFHASLKCETFYLNPELKSSTEIVAQTVLQYIQYYNEYRIQEKLGYVSPIQYRMNTVS